MPPAISDDEASDLGDLLPPVTSKRAKSASKDRDLSDDDDMLDVVENGDKDDAPAADDDEAGEEGDEDEDLDEDEFIVEKIISHVVEVDGNVRFKVKWEGYEKKSDQTWEDEENLRENAALVLDAYLESIGGRDKIVDDTQAALKSKKRGRPSAGAPANGTKRRRGDHPASSTPPASSGRAWKPPGGSWEEEVESIDACHDENSGKLIVYLTWKNGQKTQHETKVIYQRCPQKMLQFYERHVKVVMAAGESLKDEHDARS